jgi:hypothetical protein
MEKPETFFDCVSELCAVTPAHVEHHQCSCHIGPDEGVGMFDGAIDVRLRGEIEYGERLMSPNKLFDRRPVSNILADEGHARLAAPESGVRGFAA